MYKILILGGYGNFGARIVRALDQKDNIQLIIAGRNLDKANALLNTLTRKTDHVAIEIDQASNFFKDKLNNLNVDCLIHTSGPYQSQQYNVAEACIETNTHYIDLSDGREFVEGFSALDKKAKEKGVLLVTGASTLPGLSSAVINQYKDEFYLIDSIRTCIAPGNQAPRGKSTIEAVLSYCGKPVKCWVNGKWTTKYGWQDLHEYIFPKLGKRWLGLCDVPDLGVFPKKYPNVKTILFHAALETKLSQFGFWSIAALTRLGLFKEPSRLGLLVYKIGELTNFLGSAHGGMFIEFKGIDQSKNPLKLTWHLMALNGHGPEIPTIPAIILAKNLAERKTKEVGAKPCIGLINLEEFDQAVEHLDISWEVVRA